MLLSIYLGYLLHLIFMNTDKPKNNVKMDKYSIILVTIGKIHKKNHNSESHKFKIWTIESMRRIMKQVKWIVYYYDGKAISVRRSYFEKEISTKYILLS